VDLSLEVELDADEESGRGLLALLIGSTLQELAWRYIRELFGLLNSLKWMLLTGGLVEASGGGKGNDELVARLVLGSVEGTMK
jgi:hypothetical protein